MRLKLICLVLAMACISGRVFSQIAVTPAITHASCVGSTNGSIQVTATGANQPYTFTWSPGGSHSNPLTGQGTNSVTLRVKDATAGVTTFTYNIGYKTSWQVMYGGMTTSGDTLIHTNDGSNTWLKTANSGNILPGSVDGWVEYVVTTTSQNKLFGLLDSASGTFWNNIDFGIILNAGGTYNTCNNGTQTSLGSYVAGDVLRVERKGTNMIYSKNNVAVQTYTIPTSMVQSRLTVRGALYNATARMENLGCSFPCINAGAGTSASVLSCSITSATLTSNTNVAGATYSWIPGGSTPTASTTVISSPGTYSVNITNPTYGCVATATLPITSTVPTLTMGPNQVINCISSSVSISGTTTTSGATFTWTPGGSAPNSSVTTVSAAGTYTLKVKNPVDGCTTTGTLSVVTNTTAPTLTITNSPTITCASPTVVITSTTTTGGPTYSWSPGSGSAASYSVTAPNTYSLKVTDPVNGCSITKTVSITSNTTAPNISINKNQTITCTNTVAVLTGTSTTSGVNYSWTPTGRTTASISTTSTGTYTLKITDPSNGCSSTATVSVLSNTTVPNISIGLNQSITCTNTVAVITGTSTTSGISYSWNPGGSTPTSYSTSVTAAGTYTLKVTATGNGCSSTATVGVLTNTAIPSVLPGPNRTITCTSPTVTLNGSSTTTGATFSWTPGGSSPASGTTSVTAAGTYSLKVTDPSNGCTATATVAVTTNTTAPNVSAGSGQTITCAASTVTLSGSSSTSGATFSWTAGGSAPSSSVTTVTTNGTYSLQVTDPSNGCTATATVAVTTNTTAPNVSAGSNQDISCAIPTGTLSGSSTTTGATFSWTPGGSASTSSVTTVTSAGTYTLKVTDPANGCSSTATVSVSSHTLIPNVNAGTGQTITCAVSTVTLSGSSTTSGATFSWTAGGSAPTSSVTTVTTDGTYSLQVTDPSNGCTATATVAVTTNTTAPNVSAGSSQTITCAVPTVTLSGSSTTSGATFSWTPGGSAPTNSVTTVSAGPWPGSMYGLTVTDPANGCSATATIVVIVKLCPVVTVDNFQNDTMKGAASFAITGGLPPYTIAWNGTKIPSSTDAYHDLLSASPGLVIDSVMFMHDIDSLAQRTYFPGLDPGTYPVTVYDSHADSVVMQVSVGMEISSWMYNNGVTTGTCAIAPFINSGMSYASGHGQCMTQSGTFSAGDDFLVPAAVVNLSLPNDLSFSVPNTSDVLYAGLEENSDTLDGSSASMGQKMMFRFNGNSTFDVIYNSSSIYNAFFVANDRFALRTDPVSGNATFYKNESPVVSTSYASVNTGNDLRIKLIPGNAAASLIKIRIIIPFRPAGLSGQGTDVTCDNDCSGIIVASGYDPSPNTPIKYELSGPLTASLSAAGVSSATFSGLCSGVYTVSFTTMESRFIFIPITGITIIPTPVVFTHTFEIAYTPNWTNMANVTSGADNSLTKVAPGTTYVWDAGASSYNVLPANQSGWIEWVAPLPNAVNAVGFSDVHGTTIYDMDYGVGVARFPLFGDFKLYVMTHNNTMIGSLLTSVGIGPFATNDVFRLTKNYSANKISLTINGTAAGSFSGVTFTDYVMDAYLQYQGGVINRPRLSFGCKKVEQYTVLRKKLDGGYYTAVDSKLLFKYDEEYADIDGKLTFNIYNKNNAVVCSDASMPSGLSPIVSNGDNRYSIDLTNASILVAGQTMPNNSFYVLEVINEKNEKWYLRFKK